MTGQVVTLTAQASPGASCAISVGPLGEPLERSLSPRQADTSGLVSWTWTAAAVDPGDYRVVVVCNGAGASSVITVRP